MAGSNQLLTMNGAETWAYVVEVDCGLRAQFSIDEWERLGLYHGQGVSVRLAGKPDQWLYLAEVVELPPTVSVCMERSFGMSGVIRQ